MSPCIVFVDEVDRFGRRTDISTDSGTSRRVFSQLLEWLGDESRKAIIIATTNVPEQLDEAFMRIGRFDYKIPILYPDFQARVQILQVHTSVVRKVPIDEIDFKKIANATEYFTGAELEELVIRASRRAFQEDAEKVTQEHFNKALKTFRIDRDAREQQVKHYLTLAEKYCDDAEFLTSLKKQTELSKAELLKMEVEH